MGAFKTIGNVIDAELEGRVRNYFFRKTPSVTTTIGIWYDLAMSGGNPTPKYWFDATPLAAKVITQSDDGGIFHGASVSPYTKFLRSLTITATTGSSLVVSPMNAILLDYLLYYPTIDDGTTDEQVMDNTVSLPRYTDGKGVQMMAVTVGLRTGGQSFTVKYTNQDGVAGRISQTVTQNAAAYIGSITTSDRAVSGSAGWMIPLANGDSGVRAVESVTMNGVDVGLFSIILVKPLAQISIRENQRTTAGVTAPPVEKDFLIPTDSLPIIEDNAYLNFIVLPQAGLSNTVIGGYTKVIWN